MDIIVPQKDSFESAKRYYRIYQCLCGIGFVISLCIAGIQMIKVQIGGIEIINTVLSIFSFLIIVSVFCIERTYNSIKGRAEETRRNGLLDNSFGTQNEIIESENYYDNDDIEKGKEKLLFNIHENSFHTMRIAEKMIKKQLVVIIPIILILLIFAYFGFRDNLFAPVVLNVFLSNSLFRRLLSLKTLCSVCHDVECSARNMESNKSSMTLPHIISLVIKYEVVIAATNIILSTRAYRILRNSLLVEWEKVRKRYPI